MNTVSAIDITCHNVDNASLKDVWDDTDSGTPPRL